MYIDNTYELPCTEVVKSGTNTVDSTLDNEEQWARTTTYLKGQGIRETAKGAKRETNMPNGGNGRWQRHPPATGPVNRVGGRDSRRTTSDPMIAPHPRPRTLGPSTVIFRSYLTGMSVCPYPHPLNCLQNTPHRPPFHRSSLCYTSVQCTHHFTGWI